MQGGEDRDPVSRERRKVVKEVRNSIQLFQFNSLFQFTQSNTIIYRYSCYLWHCILQKINFVFIKLFMIAFSLICMSWEIGKELVVCHAPPFEC